MKKNLDDLAIFGGSPAFREYLHVGRPNIVGRQKILERIETALERCWLTNNGPFVQELEQKLAELLGVRHCIVMCNGTVALEIAIRAVGLRGEVIIPSFTFIATAHALQWQEITPVFCDVDPHTHTIAPKCIEALITPRTTGIIGVHVWGRPCAIEALSEICHRHHLSLLFDAAHAFGCSHQGQFVGNFGRAEVFSFHATKFFNTFEGGAVATNDDELAAKVRLMSNFGFAGADRVIYIGTNGKMNEISAAMGLTSLECLAEIVDVNYRNYQQYQSELDGLPGIQLVRYNEQEKNNCQYIVIELDEAGAGLSRDELINILWAENILARRYFYPGCHEMEPYRSYFPHAGLLLPETIKLTRRVMSLPTGIAIGPEAINLIGQIIRTAILNGQEAHMRLMNKEIKPLSKITYA